MFDPSIHDQSISVTRGYNMVFGVLSKQMLQLLGNRIFEVLMTNCLLKGKENDDAETRKQACKSLIIAVMVLGIHNLQPETRNKILETFYSCFDDYAVDRRGDVGSWVRQEAMMSVNKYVSLIVECQDEAVK